jgi:hypothetical protein
VTSRSRSNGSGVLPLRSRPASLPKPLEPSETRPIASTRQYFADQVNITKALMGRLNNALRRKKTLHSGTIELIFSQFNTSGTVSA